MSFTQKKKNFTSFEKKLLLEYMVPFKDVIESKKIDSTSMKSKQEAWIKIAAAFNASSLINEKATEKQLQRLWTNLKQRGELAKEQQHRWHDSDNLQTDRHNTELNKKNIETKKLTNKTDTSYIESRRISYKNLKRKLIQEKTEQRRKRDLQIIELEKQLYEEKIETEKEKRKEAKARADLAELELEEYRKNLNC